MNPLRALEVLRDARSERRLGDVYRILDEIDATDFDVRPAPPPTALRSALEALGFPPPDNVWTFEMFTDRPVSDDQIRSAMQRRGWNVSW